MSVYNGAEYLDAAIRSIRSQTFHDFEFIIVDDGSTDSTPDILAAHAQEDFRLRIIRQDRNLGQPEALNRGIAAARAQYIARMDADDIAHPDRLRKQTAFLDANPRVAVVGSRIEVVDRRGRFQFIVSFPTNPESVRARLKITSPLCHPAVLLRREIFLAAGGYRKLLAPAEDYDLWLRISEIAELANLPEVLLSYRQHAGSLSFQKTERQGIGILLAQAAARARSAGRIDPCDYHDELGDALLASLDISAIALTCTKLDALRGAAFTMLFQGEYRDAASYLRRAAQHLRNPKGIAAAVRLMLRILKRQLRWGNLESTRRNVVALCRLPRLLSQRSTPD